MPIYEFTCKKCKHDFEELIFNRSEKVACPECGSKKVVRAMSVFSHSSGGTYRSSAGSSCTSCAKSSCAGCGGGGS
jgi:putative FmdB family regulatory protein